MIKMQSIIIPDFPQLQGKEAIEALNTFIQEVEEKELTKKQTKTLKKFAKGIIRSIEAKQNIEPQKKEMGFIARMRASIEQRSQNAGQASKN